MHCARALLHHTGRCACARWGVDDALTPCTVQCAPPVAAGGGGCYAHATANCTAVCVQSARTGVLYRVTSLFVPVGGTVNVMTAPPQQSHRLVEASITHDQVRDALRRAQRERCIAAARAHESGLSYGAIGRRLGMSKNNAVTLVRRGQRFLAEDQANKGKTA